MLLRSTPRLRHWVIRAVSAATPAWRATAWAARRTVLRRTRFVVIVGSYGKTTTARAVSEAVLGTASPYLERNARFWTALAMLRTPWRQRHQVLEVGISKPGQMQRAARFVRPDVTVVTSIGSEHHRSLGSLEVTRAEKCKMVEALPPDGVAVLNGDDPHVMWMRSRAPCRVVTFGTNSDCDVRLVDSRLQWPHGIELDIAVPGANGSDLGTDRRLSVRTRLLSETSARSVLAAVAVCHAEGLPLDDALHALDGFEASRGRLQLLEGNGVTVIRDDHKSSYETIEAALDALEAVPAGRRICVLGRVSEPPGSQSEVYKQLGRRVAQVADLAIFVANRENCRQYAVGAKAAGMAESAIVRIDRDPLEALERLRELVRPGDTVLVKGRDNQRLGRISLGIIGQEVRCGVLTCRLACNPCDDCARLATGWPGNPIERP